MLPIEFIQMIGNPSIEFQIDSNVFSSVSIAQACLETGYGKSIPIDYLTKKKSYNIFGVKWNGKGEYVTSLTREVVDGKDIFIYAKFQAYKSLYESIESHGKLVGYSKRYKPVRDAKTPEEQAHQLYKCGYATDPLYAEKLIKIINTWNLKYYDNEVVKMTDTIKQLQKQVNEQAKIIKTLQDKHEMNVPEWAKYAVESAVSEKLIDSPEKGSFDFYRIITILFRANLLKKKV